MSKRGSAARIGGLVAAFVLIACFWDYAFMTPLKILVVFFHEISHGLAAVLTGGSIVNLKVSADQSGLACTTGGCRFVVLSAGYLGSFAWGSALILAAAFVKRARILSGLLGVVLAAITLLYVRNPFGILFGALAAAAFLASARWLNDLTNDFLIRVVGVTSCGYAILDIYSDTISRKVCCSDASRLASITFIPSLVWGVLWVALSVYGIYWTLKLAAKADQ
ncbi:MAG: M50 family metallopeptidase [Elusimicrobiota bacterium]